MNTQEPANASVRKPRLDPATALIRGSVTAMLADFEPSTWVVAVSGGTDSIVLAAACAFLNTRGPHTFYGVTIDHGLQTGSAEIAANTLTVLRKLGLKARVHRVQVTGAQTQGVEAAARAARYQGLRAVATEIAARGILTAHTQDDQAETVLLGLARGSGARSLAGMRPVSGDIFRPLLAVTREQTEASAQAQQLPVWDDPMNTDPSYTRVRVRTQLLPALSTVLGEGVKKNLARTALLMAADADELDRQAAVLVPTYVHGVHADRLSITAAELPPALRTRVVRDWLLQHCPAAELNAGHIERASLLLTGQRTGAVSVPARAEVRRICDEELVIVRLEPSLRNP